jgi:hypothetical protein
MRISIPAALAVCALALAACGAEEPAGESGAADPEQERRQAMLDFAACMRDHGVDMPDPRPGERGIVLRRPEGASEAKMREADEACRKHLDAVRPPELSEEQQEEFKKAALAHAECLREHGIDVPDPKVGEDGRVEMRIERGSGIDPESSKFREAHEACRDEMPGQGGSLSTPSSP